MSNLYTKTIDDVSETEDEGFSVQGIIQPFSFTDCSYYPIAEFNVIDSSGGCAIKPSWQCHDTLFVLSYKHKDIDNQSAHGVKSIDMLSHIISSIRYHL